MFSSLFAQFPHNHQLAILFAGIAFSAIGSDLADIAFTLRAADTKNAGFLTAVLLAQAIPGVFLTLVGGTFADRRMRAWVWPLSLLVEAAVFAILAVQLSNDVIVAGVATVSTISALTGPVARKLASHYSRDAEATAASLTTLTGLANVVGCVLGGLGFALVDVRTLMWVNAASFVVLAVAGMMVSTSEAIALDRGPRRGVLFGFEKMMSNELFGPFIFTCMMVTIFGTSLEGISGVFVVRGHLHLSAIATGLVWACWGVGLIFGGPLARGLKMANARGIVAGSGIMGIVFVVIPHVPAHVWMTTPLACLLFIVGGQANSMFNAAVGATIIAKVPAQEQGRTWAAFGWLVTCCFLAGYLIAGVAGAQHAVLVVSLSGLIPLLSVGVAVVRMRGQRGDRSEPVSP